MTSYPTPGGSQEPPSFSQVDADAFCRRLEPTLEPHEIAPAEVFGADEYVTVSRRIWHETKARCLDNEIRAARLQQDYAALERRNRGLMRALWAATVCCAVAVMALFTMWRAM